MNQSTLGSFIRSLRIQNNMTQARLAEILHVTDKAVSKWERDLAHEMTHLAYEIPPSRTRNDPSRTRNKSTKND